MATTSPNIGDGSDAPCSPSSTWPHPWSVVHGQRLPCETWPSPWGTYRIVIPIPPAGFPASPEPSRPRQESHRCPLRPGTFDSASSTTPMTPRHGGSENKPSPGDTHCEGAGTPFVKPRMTAIPPGTVGKFPAGPSVADAVIRLSGA